MGDCTRMACFCVQVAPAEGLVRPFQMAFPTKHAVTLAHPGHNSIDPFAILGNTLFTGRPRYQPPHPQTDQT